VAFEKRIAAAIADPGVADVATSWTAKLTPPIIGLFDNFVPDGVEHGK
jgi:hypothetical protein